MSEEKIQKESQSDAALAQEGEKLLFELMKEDERKKFMSNYVSKEEMQKTLAEELAKRDVEYDKMKTAILRAKAQGKAHIVEENPDPDAELVKLYGKGSLVHRALSKNR